MSTIAMIHHEAATLSGEQQKKVLAFIELLKYKATIRQVEQLSKDLGGIKEMTDEEIRSLSDGNEQIHSDQLLDGLQEKIAIAERVSQALDRMKAGEPGISQKEMKKRIRQWQNK